MYEIGLILQYGLMIAICTMNFKKRRHRIVTFTTCCKMFVDALCVIFFVTYGPSVVTITFSNRPFRLANVV